MFSIIFIILFIALIVHLVSHRKPKMTAFDQFLMERHLESEKRAAKIPNVEIEPARIPDAEILPEQADLSWQIKMYKDMIKTGKYDTESLIKELKELHNINYA